MQKRNQFLLLAACALLLALLAHFSGRMAAAEPAFTFAKEEKEVYLTFDDGPSTVVTGSILDTLKKEDVKATFFVVGERIAGREKVLRRMAEEGHTIGVHSMTHRYEEIYASTNALIEDVKACAARIQRAANITPHVYRFPGGGRHKEAETLLKEMGYRIVWWNAVCGDAEGAEDDAAMLTTTLSTAKGKARVVLLMHDRADCTATAKALPAIIQAFREEGCVFRAF